MPSLTLSAHTGICSALDNTHFWFSNFCCLTYFWINIFLRCLRKNMATFSSGHH